MQGQRLRCGLLALAGIICVGLGTLGIFVPGLPTTVFLLLASFLFSKSVPSLERRLREHRRLGAYLKAAEGGEMPLRAKVICLAAMWSGIVTSIAVLGGSLSAAGGPVTLVAAGLVGSVGILYGGRIFARVSRPRRWSEARAPMVGQV